MSRIVAAGAAFAFVIAGVRQPLLRGNGARIHPLDNAFFKAYSAASQTRS